MGPVVPVVPAAIECLACLDTLLLETSSHGGLSGWLWLWRYVRTLRAARCHRVPTRATTPPAAYAGSLTTPPHLTPPMRASESERERARASESERE